MPWTVDDPPRPCRNLKGKPLEVCVEAANEALRQGKSEGEASRIGAAAAKRVRHKQGLDPDIEERYLEEQEETAEYFRDLGLLVAAGLISLEEFRERMRERLRDYLIALALLADPGFDSEDEEYMADLEGFLRERYGLLEDFIKDIRSGGLSAAQIAWRAGLYAGARHVFVRYLVPRKAFVMMPFLPGISCEGDGWCQCWLEEEEEEDGTIIVYWYLGIAEHCQTCLEAESLSPYIFEPH